MRYGATPAPHTTARHRAHAPLEVALRPTPAVLAALALACVEMPAGVETAPTDLARTAPVRPNIVYVLLDDLDATTSPYWEALPRTQARLQARGVTFTEAFAPTPICCAARASILTGMYGHNTGVITNGGAHGGWYGMRNAPDGADNEDRTVAVYLEEAGYRTALIGKYLNGIEDDPTHVPRGWTDWHVGVDERLDLYTGYGYTLNSKTAHDAEGTLVTYGHTEADYFTDVVADLAMDLVDDSERDDDRPFFLMLAPTAPHLPIQPARRHRDHPWADASVPRTPNYDEDDLSDKPLWLQLSGDRRSRIMPWTEVDYRARMGSLLAVDEMIAGVLDRLAANGELDNTYVVFSSDNGYNQGAHRLVHKMAPYEESVRVPLVIAGPGIGPGTSSDMALHIDLAPTFLEWAGLQPPAHMDGRPLTPLLDGRSPRSWRDDFVVQYGGGGAANGIGAELPQAFWWLATGDIPGYRALRTTDRLYVEWHEDTAFDSLHEYELYDLDVDPFQLDNLLADPQGLVRHRRERRALERRLDELAACSGADCSRR